MNIYREFRKKICTILENLVVEQRLAKDISLDSVIVEPPRDSSHGELATNAALVVAKISGLDPFKVAELIKNRLTFDKRVSSIQVVKPGFLNFTLKPAVWHDIVKSALKEGDKFGSSRIGAGKRINIEYVSANPTGPLHVGHTRGAVFGDSLGNLLEFMGFNVTREYYINDAGNQIDSLARSVYLRYMELHGNKVDFSGDVYPGEYLIDVAQDLKKIFKDQLLNLPEKKWIAEIKEFASDAMLKLIKSDLALLGVQMDNYYSEKQLYNSGKIDDAIASLDSKGLIYDGILAAPKGKVVDDYE